MCVTVTVYGYSVGNIAVVNTETIEFKSLINTKVSKQYPLGVAITPNNQLTVTDSVNACVKVFSTDGQLVQLCGGEFDFL